MAGDGTILDLIKSKPDSEDRLKPSTCEQQALFGAESSSFFAHVEVRVIHDETFQTGFRRELITGTRARSTMCNPKSDRSPNPLPHNQKLTQEHNIHVICPNLGGMCFQNEVSVLGGRMCDWRQGQDRDTVLRWALLSRVYQESWSGLPPGWGGLEAKPALQSKFGQRLKTRTDVISPQFFCCF